MCIGKWTAVTYEVVTKKPVEQSYHRWAYARRYLGMLTAVIAFGLIYYAYIFTERGQYADALGMASMILWTHRYHDASIFILDAASIPVMIGVIVVSAIIAGFRRRWAMAIRVAIMIAGAALSSYVLKFYVLPRPLLGVTYGVTNSFPSGHVTLAACAAFAFIMVVSHAIRPWAALFGAFIISLMGIVVVSHSWHRPSDVIGAILVVAFWALLTQPIETSRHFQPLTHKVLYIVATIIFIASVVTNYLAFTFIKSATIFPLTTSPANPYEALTTAGQTIPPVAGVAATLTIITVAFVCCLYVERQVHAPANNGNNT